MEPDQIIERIGSENPPTVDELTTAKTELEAAKETLAGTIRENKGGNLDDLLAMKGDYDAVGTALSAVTDALTDAEAAIAAIVAEVGDAEPVEVVEVEEVTEAEAEVQVPVAASIRQTLARVRTRPVEIDQDVRDLSSVTTTYELAGKERDHISPAEIGKTFSTKQRGFGGVKTTLLSIKTEMHDDRTLKGDAASNERKLLDLFGTNTSVPVTASGGCCSIPTPIYDQPLLGDLSRPIRAAFDTLNASRGAVTNYPPVCIPDEGADVWTCAQDAAVDEEDPDTWKSCVEVECAEAETTLVEPIYKCLTIGTFQQKFAPEQWEAILFQTDKLAARLAEARLFNWLAASATSVYDEPITSGSTYANFIKQQIRIAAGIRQDQRLGDAQLVTVGSNLIYSAIAEDTLTRRLNDTEQVEFFKDKVDSVLREFGITYVGSDDVSALTAFTYSGSFPAYPGEFPMVTLPAGSAKVLDGGEKNLGIDIADHNLNRQNKVAAFSEFWEGLLVRNCNVVFSTVNVEDCELGCPPVAS